MTTLTKTLFDLDAAPMAVSHVTLDVRDMQRTTHFYRDVIGLNVHATSTNEVTLGAAQPFLTLRSRPDAIQPNPRAPGLFHIAFLLTERTDLGAWLRHAADYGVYPYGASDHNVSEAIYLDDPEGNGIEIYVDRPVEDWSGVDGNLYMPSRRLDLAALPKGRWTGIPAATRIGHVHLQTTTIAEADDFWTGVGMNVTARYPGGSFFGAGGYHHQIAANVWGGGQQPPKQQGTAGLAEITLTSDRPTETLLAAPSGVSVRLLPKGH